MGATGRGRGHRRSRRAGPVANGAPTVGAHPDGRRVQRPAQPWAGHRTRPAVGAPHRQPLIVGATTRSPCRSTSASERVPVDHLEPHRLEQACDDARVAVGDVVPGGCVHHEERSGHDLHPRSPPAVSSATRRARRAYASARGAEDNDTVDSSAEGEGSTAARTRRRNPISSSATRSS